VFSWRLTNCLSQLVCRAFTASIFASLVPHSADL
jgi:hypothetical protein